MSDLFYYAGIIFLIDIIRSVIMAKKEIDLYKAAPKIPSNLLSQDDMKSARDTLIGQIKGKILPSIMGLLTIVWLIVGLYTPEWKLFLANITSVVVSTTLIGYNKNFRTVIFIVISGIINSCILAAILQSHFAQ